MRFGLLGPVVVQDGGDQAVEPAGIPGALLAVLLLQANRVVAHERLAEAVWGEDAPSAVAAGLRNHVLRLRRQLGPQAGARVRTAAGGYLVEVREGELDEQVFVDGCRRGRQALRSGDPAEAARILSSALALWRGEPLAGLPLGSQAETQVQRLHEVRLLALEGRIEADLLLGRHGEVVAELRALTTAHPLREVLHGQLMLALYRAGRQAEALDVFHALRRTLVQELGLEPSTEVRTLHQQILVADPALTPPTRPETAADAGPRSQLPSDTRVFTGRERELDELLALARATAHGQGGGGTLEVCVIDGMGGIGKSALAVHAAHRLRTEFPDGQLFIDLHSHTPGMDPLTAGDALDWLLRSLGVPRQLIPEDPAERAALYRDRLADTRTLVVLDNAASTAQIRPLLPAAPGCLVLVTSRRRLTGLDDAHILPLDILPDADATALLHAVAGPGRVPAGHPAARRLIRLCGHMPLAIRITAARLRHHPTLPLEDAVEHLRDEHARLGYLQDEDRNLTAIFESSYTALPGAEQHLFRLLGLVPGPDFDAYAAAALTAATHREAERLLESLLDHNLLFAPTPGRYRLHDLLRLYTRNLSADTTDQQAALTGLLDYYQEAANAAGRHLTRYTRPGTPPTAAASCEHRPPLPDHAAALSWMRSEFDNLIAAITHAADHAEHARVVVLTAALDAFLLLEEPLALSVSLHRAAISAARRSGDRLGEANAAEDLGRVYLMTSGHAAASTALGDALALYRSLGDRLGEANSLHDLARTHHLVSDFATAAELHGQALALYQELDDRLGEANALHDTGRTRMMIGDISTATAMVERSQELFREFGHVQGQANALWTLGRLYYSTGDYPGAAEALLESVRLSEQVGARLGQANGWFELGRVRYTTGDYRDAATLYARAKVAYREMGVRVNEAHAVWELGRVQQATGDPAAAIRLYRQALPVLEQLHVRQGQANILHDLGRARQALGESSAADDLYRRSRAIFEDLGDRQGRARVLNSMGALAAQRTDPVAGLELHQQALRLAREIHNPLDQARALAGIARCTADTGDQDAALTAQRQAVALYQRIGAAETAAARQQLAALEAGGRPHDR